LSGLPLKVFETSDALADAAALVIAGHLRRAVDARGRAVFVPSSGRTPGPTYARLRDDHADALDWSCVHVLQMDEYADPDLPEELRFSTFLTREIVGPLKVGAFTSLRTERGRAEARRLAEEIDLVVHGIGTNGHIGFNEPGDAQSEGQVLRRVALTRATMRANFGEDESLHPLPLGDTLTLSALRTAKHSLLLARGESKQRAVATLMSGEHVNSCPAAILRTARSAELFADKVAARYTVHAAA
jgi:glucosamine-6-phosphate deaminase